MLVKPTIAIHYFIEVKNNIIKSNIKNFSDLPLELFEPITKHYKIDNFQYSINEFLFNDYWSKHYNNSTDKLIERLDFIIYYIKKYHAQVGVCVITRLHHILKAFYMKLPHDKTFHYYNNLYKDFETYCNIGLIKDILNLNDSKMEFNGLYPSEKYTSRYFK